MTENPKSYDVILLDHYEEGVDQSGAILTLFSVDGTSYKIGAKRQQLWHVRTLPQYTPIVLVFETFTPKDSKDPITYIVDAHKLEAYDVDMAAIRGTLKRLLMAKDEDRQRSQALSYAKDLACAEITANKSRLESVDDLLKLATTFYAFIKGQPEIYVHVETEENADE